MPFGPLDRFIIALVPISFFISVAAVFILRPLTTRLAELLTELRAQRAITPASAADTAELRRTIEALSERLQRIEEKQEFADALLESSTRKDLPR
jgi:hypothetical protein